MTNRLFPPVACSLLSLLCACNATDNERYNLQKESYQFTSTSSTLTAFGASRNDDSSQYSFRCPSVSGMNRESGITVFHAQANAPFPHFTLKTMPGIRSDQPGGFGISLSDFPIGLLDLYQRCNSSAQDRLTTVCPDDYKVVSECSDPSQNAKECILIHEGTHQLALSSRLSDDKACFTEEVDRSPYSTSAPTVSYACDTFAPIPIAAAYRGELPSNNCCSEQSEPTLDFCIKPCGCRELIVEILPKSELNNTSSQPPLDENDELHLAVFSNVEGDSKSLTELLQSIQTKKVDMAISLGSLTSDGSTLALLNQRSTIREAFQQYDGNLETQTGCYYENEESCCSEEAGRQYSNICNATLSRTAFLAGLGEHEEDGALNAFNMLFGPTHTSTVIGKVQLIMLDTANAKLADAEMTWLKGVLDTPEMSECKISGTAPNGEWPLLAECAQNTSSSQKVTCRECIGQEAYCVPPDAERSTPWAGPANCVCIPQSSNICLNTMSCKTLANGESRCVCSRNSDCGEGATCIDGQCIPPMRLAFSYTPLFDEFGSRNAAFTDKEQAAKVLSILGKGKVSAIFSGRARDYASFSKAGIQMYITGGGNNSMSSFARKGRHWLYVTIPHAYTAPKPDEMTVEVIEF